MPLRLQALDQLAITWYATGMDRVREVRRTLAPLADTSSASGTSTTGSTAGGRRSARLQR